jgi:hypothetical protein
VNAEQLIHADCSQLNDTRSLDHHDTISQHKEVGGAVLQRAGDESNGFTVLSVLSLIIQGSCFSVLQVQVLCCLSMSGLACKMPDCFSRRGLRGASTTGDFTAVVFTLLCLCATAQSASPCSDEIVLISTKNRLTNSQISAFTKLHLL